MIKLDNIKKVFRTDDVETWALQNVSLEVKEGEFVAIMGPSGCGKSTLLNILGLIDNPTEGTYLLNGTDVSRMQENERTELRKGTIGFVFQSFNLIEELNVVENIELPLLYMGISRSERRRRVQEIMERVGIAHRSKHFPCQLSGGQQQRVAKALAHKSDLGSQLDEVQELASFANEAKSFVDDFSNNARVDITVTEDHKIINANAAKNGGDVVLTFSRTERARRR